MLKENPKGKENSPKVGVGFSYSLPQFFKPATWFREGSRADTFFCKSWIWQG